LIYPGDKFRPAIFLHFCNVLTVFDNLTFIRGKSSAEQIQHGRFSGTIAANDSNKIIIVNRKVKVRKENGFIYGPRLKSFVYMT